MKKFSKGLIFKLGGVLLLLLFIKLLMITVGIYSAGHLKGDATAINHAGSERMRSYKLSYLINKWLNEEGQSREYHRKEINQEVRRFESILAYLREGEKGAGKNRYDVPQIITILKKLCPFAEDLIKLPGIYEPDLRMQIEIVNNKWYGDIKPLIEDILKTADRTEARDLFLILNERLPPFVDEVDHFVAYLEDSFNRKMMVFAGMQYFFLFITLIVTMIALYIIFLVTKKSVHGLMEGIRSMTAGDFSKRVEIVSNDEMGELAEGFNFMAEKLEELYGNLEKKVREKTEALEDRNKELSILYDVVASLNKTLSLEELLLIFLEKLQEYLGISSGAIRILEDDGNLRLAASLGLNDTFKANIAFGECLCGLLSKQDASPAWCRTELFEVVKLKECKDCNFKAVVEIPINYKDRHLGVINLFQDDIRNFSAQEKLLVESLNNHLGAVIEYYNLNNKTNRLAIMEERNMLAHELHDSIAQSIAYLKIQANLLEESLKSNNLDQALDDLLQMRKGIEESNLEVRELLVHFRARIESEGLEATIRKFLNKFRKETGIRAEFVSEPDVPNLSPDAEIHVLHIVQEALTNARKYSNASKVKVTLKGDGNFGVIIEDNGEGFDLDEVKKKGASHVGIDIMRERAIRLGAKLLLESKIGDGTRVHLMM